MGSGVGGHAASPITTRFMTLKFWTDKINKRYKLFKMLSTIITFLNENTVCYFKNCTKLRET